MSAITFVDRHIGPRESDIPEMVHAIGLNSLNQLIDQTIPAPIRLNRSLDLPQKLSESQALEEIRKLAIQNKCYRSLIGMGYYGTLTPGVIQRNILENPGWYTQYTPYQAEVAQGRLEALLNFQTMIADLTGLPISNASLLDEATAAAEAMGLCFSVKGSPEGAVFAVSNSVHPQTRAVIQTRAEPLGIKIISFKEGQLPPEQNLIGAIVQYPNTWGEINDYRAFSESLKSKGALVVVATDLMALTVLTPPGEWGADITIGSAQRFGVPMGFGGPHAAFMSTKDEYKRLIPGRLVGVSIDSNGKPALRLALQTREQHIRREKATSNICTAQALLAIMSSMYAVFHGPKGLVAIANQIRKNASQLKSGLESLSIQVVNRHVFDTVTVQLESSVVKNLKIESEKSELNFRYEDGFVSISFDELTNESEVLRVLNLFAFAMGKPKVSNLKSEVPSLGAFQRKSEFLKHPVFNKYRSETEMLRYIHRLETRDLSLNASMIPLGSCTMKLNATSEMIPVTWAEFGGLHPFAPSDQTQGYQQLFKTLEGYLSEITGFDGTSLQPNAGSQGEYAGLLVIRKFHQSQGHSNRNICLIPRSAHGTNPASAVMAGMKVVVVECDSDGNVDLNDLRSKAKTHQTELAALMITYPSTHGVFETTIKEICDLIHQSGGQVYLDGANTNAQVGLCRPGDYGADVCHLNLHKTFCIPHGGGGPGMGPICVKKHLVQFLPGHPVGDSLPKSVLGPVSAAAWGSPSILPISWMYIRMMGPDGLKRATEFAILNANYIAKKLEPHFPVLYRSNEGWVAHECIIDLRKFKETAGVEVEDVAKRLMDYGFHAPTISWPVAGTMMIEPTESESKEEMDRFCDAMISIRKEIAAIEAGKMDRQNNLLKNAPHTAEHATRSEWNHSYSREEASYPAKWLKEYKFWPFVGRINNVHGDRNLICTCPSMDDF